MPYIRVHSFLLTMYPTILVHTHAFIKHVPIAHVGVYMCHALQLK